MASHSSWKGFISFGLLQFPVKMYTAARDKRVELHTYHTACNGPVKKPNWCPKCNVQLQDAEIFKGFEKADSSVVPLLKDEIKAITPASEKSMEITECVPLADIDLMYFAESFYLLPDAGGNKAYSLLAQTLRETQSVAIAQLCKSSREHIALIRPKGNGLALHFMWYADEIAQIPEFESFKPVDVSATEAKLAKQLIASMNGEFNHAQYEDGYRGRLNTLIASKLDKSVAAPAPVQSVNKVATMDLAAALEKSLANRPKRKVVPQDDAPAKSKKGKKVAA